MKRTLVTLAMAAVLGAWCSAQVETTVPPQSIPDHETRAVKITHGPVVELITDSTAQIAWSTNVNAGTLLHYGTEPGKLNLKASMPWGGLTHRVFLKHLSPSTMYYFVAESPQGQDTGTRAEAAQSSFKTVAPGEPPIHHMDRR